MQSWCVLFVLPASWVQPDHMFINSTTQIAIIVLSDCPACILMGYATLASIFRGCENGEQIRDGDVLSVEQRIMSFVQCLPVI